MIPERMEIINIMGITILLNAIFQFEIITKVKKIFDLNIS